MSVSKKKIDITVSLIICAVIALAAVSSAGMVTAAPASRSIAAPANAPIVNTDGTVTFTLRAPGATRVFLNLQNLVGASPAYNSYLMTDDGTGLWSITMGPTVPGLMGWTNPPAPLAPDWYAYGFNIDGTPPVIPPTNPTVFTTVRAAGGVNIADPANRNIWSGDTSAWSYVFVPGPAADFMADDPAVPHGAVATVRYFSNVEQKERQMQVYTPPGYNKDNRRYPVLYIQHGAGGNDMDWIVNMRANYIMDNLIAQGVAEPMILVSHDNNVGGANYLVDYPEELMGSIVPYIEENYRTAPGAKNRALAGLSRGGRCTFAALVKYPGYFAYIGHFGSEYTVTADYPVELLDNPAINEGTKLLLITVGDETDISYTRTHTTLALLDEHGVNYTFIQRTGGHVWGVWRDDLQDFAPLLFKK